MLLHFSYSSIVTLHFVKGPDLKFYRLVPGAMINMPTYIYHSSGNISNMLLVNGDSVTEGVTCFANIFLVTPTAPNHVKEIFHLA